MVYKTQGDYGDNYKDILFDMRQFRVKLISAHILDVYKAQKDRNYGEWVRGLELLYATVEHMIKEKRFDVEEHYNTLKEDAIKVINKYKLAAQRKSNDPQGVQEIEKALLLIQRFLFERMHKKGVFGRQWDEPGL